LPRMTGGQAITESLKAHEVDTIFGIISIHTLDLFDSIFDNQDSLRFIGGRQELGCGFMADGYSRATGKPGILLTSTGPGAADSVGALGEAYFSSSSVLEICTNVEQEFIGSGKLSTHETKNQLGMFEAVTDWNALINQIESIPDYFVEAFKRFQSRRPRPIELEVPTDLLGQQADVEVLGPRDPQIAQGDPAMVERARKTLIEAKRPVIFVGEEVQSLGGAEEIIQLAEMLGAPIVTGDGAKGTIPEDHPLSLGPAMGGRIWGENPLHDWLSTCDVVLVLGSILPLRSTSGVGLKLPDTLIHVLLDGEAIGKNYATGIPIVADSRAVTRQLLEGMAGTDVYKGDKFKEEIASVKEQIYKTLKDTWGNELRTFEAIRASTAKHTIFALDATVPTSRAIRCLEINQPRTFMYPHGWVGLGFAFPAALGAKIGKPKSPVVCVTGDGGFQYNFQELATAAQYGINPIVLMFNDNAWGVLKGMQQQNHKGRLIGTDLVNPDFVKLFESYGFEGTKVTSVDQLSKALEDAVASDKVQMIEVQTPDGFGAFR